MRVHICNLYIPLLLVACSNNSGKPDIPETPVPDPPGVVVAHSPKTSEIYLGSPSLAVLQDGTYIVSYNESGPATKGYPNETLVYSSEDEGLTWSHISTISGQTWSGLFTLGGELYIMGTKGPQLQCYIRKSTDGGRTWSTPSDSSNGILLPAYPKCHTAPVPVVKVNGRIWRAMEVKSKEYDVWPKCYNAMIMSAPENADLLDADSWQESDQLKFDSSYLDGFFGGWLEGNAVVAPDGTVKLIMRVELPSAYDGEKIAIIDVSEDGKNISFDPAKGFVKMPGGAKKFCIRYDDVSGRYWTLSNYVKPQYRFKNPGTIRNTLALCSSENLTDWNMHEFVLEHEDAEYHAFQYVDWQIDGDDIIFVSRTAFDDKSGGADSAHNSNFITFHRVNNFRDKMSEIIKY